MSKGIDYYLGFRIQMPDCIEEVGRESVILQLQDVIHRVKRMKPSETYEVTTSSIEKIDLTVKQDLEHRANLARIKALQRKKNYFQQECRKAQLEINEIEKEVK